MTRRLAALLLTLGGAVAAEAQPVRSTLRIVARDFFFQGQRDSVPAGLTRIILDNRGADYHHVVLARLAPGWSLEAVLYRTTNSGAAIEGLTFVGGPEGRQPSGVSEATVLLQPGRYALLDLVEGTDGQGHTWKGMINGFTVVGPSQPALAAPPRAVQVSLSNHAFTVTGAPQRAGRREFWATNTGAQEHHVLLADLEPGRTLADVYAYFQRDRAGAPPFRFQGGTSRLSRGESALFTGQVTPGRSFLICVNTDPASRTPHVMLGMLKQL